MEVLLILVPLRVKNLWFAWGWDHQEGDLGTELVGDSTVVVGQLELSGD